MAVPESACSSVCEEQGDEEHNHQSVLVEVMSGRKVVEFAQDYIIIFAIISHMCANFLLGTLRFLWYPIYTKMEEPRQQVRIL